MPKIFTVKAPLRVTVFPVTSVTATATPSPLLNTNPGPIPVLLVTVMVVSPMIALAPSVVDAAVPPDPVTAVICVPVLTPVPVRGAPIPTAPALKPI